MVNALLTQLDKLKHRKNCLIMTTSNLSEAIGQSRVPLPDTLRRQNADLIFWLGLALRRQRFHRPRRHQTIYRPVRDFSLSLSVGSETNILGRSFRQSANCSYLLDSPLLPAGNHARRAGPGSGAFFSSPTYERNSLLTVRVPFLLASDGPQDGRSLPLGGHERG